MKLLKVYNVNPLDELSAEISEQEVNLALRA